MHSLLLFDVTEREISVDALQRVFRSAAGFHNVRHNAPGGSPIEADYVDGDDFTTVDLSESRKAISIRGTSGAALSAAWMLRKHLDIALRMVDTEYSFDLIVSNFSSIAELQSAIDRCQNPTDCVLLGFIHRSFHIWLSAPAADAAQIASMKDYFGTVPTEYLTLVSVATEIELRNSSDQYLRIWGPAGCMERDEAYFIRHYIPGALPIGDDGGGHVIFYHNGKQGFGLYHVGFGNLDANDAIWIAPSLSDLLTRGIGAEALSRII